VTVHLGQSVKREKTNKMQQSDVYYQLLSQHVSGIIMPIFRRTKTVCYCMWCTALVLLDVVGTGFGALRCRVPAHGFRQKKTCESLQKRSCTDEMASKNCLAHDSIV